MALLLRDVLRDPHEVAEHVNDNQARVHLTVDEHGRDGVAFYATFQPPTAFADEGYSAEQARIIVLRKATPRTIPLGPPRPWKHRNGPFGDLCMWFDGDPRGLRWEWLDGFGAYVAIAHRHLFFEEMWRRTGSWPVEDAPHGSEGHPIRTLEMQWKAKLWSR